MKWNTTFVLFKTAADMGEEDKMLLIRRNDFLAQLTPEDYDGLNIVHNFIEAEKGNYLYFDAHALSHVYFVKEGFVKIGAIDEDGNEIIKDILQPGDLFGQFSLDPACNMYGEFAQAHKSNVALCSFSVKDMQVLLETRPMMAIKYSMKVGQKLRKMEYRIINLLQKDVRTRLLQFLYSMTREKRIQDGQIEMENYLTHEDMARLIGASRQTVTTLLNQFETEKLITITRTTIVLLQPKVLMRLANVV